MCQRLSPATGGTCSLTPTIFCCSPHTAGRCAGLRGSVFKLAMQQLQSVETRKVRVTAAVFSSCGACGVVSVCVVFVVY